MCESEKNGEVKNILYAVIILNYNTIDDAIMAANSVKMKAQTNSYIICIADNASSKIEDRDRCKAYKSSHIITVSLEKNNGYAKGNNEAIEFVKKKYNPRYYVIMNPDVLVLDNGTIEGMIEQIETKDHIVGGQPLVWNCYYGDDAALQQNIRVVPTYMDLCMLSFEPLKILMRSRYKRMIYQNRMPFNEEIEYRVPSGAFFLIKANIFDEMGKFDEETFLYYEEHIIGKKLEKIGKNLLFMPQFKVRHEHGKSIGNNRTKVNKFALKCSSDSRNYYAKQYLKCHVGKILILKILDFLNIPFSHIKVYIYNKKDRGKK